ncbi:MAG: alpha/beta hydrolase [Polaromonas sp.]|nr:alpha/beta hydrolase [Polaromonas sp.]
MATSATDAAGRNARRPRALPADEQLNLRAQGLNFRVALAGPEDGALVMMLHGFPETSYAWRHQWPALAAAGFRVAMPDQRGYGGSDKPAGRHVYRLSTLAEDVVQLAAALGHTRFSLVGHDWGGVLAWHMATHHAAHLNRVAVLNAPHPATLLGYSLKNPSQFLRSAYVGLFQLPLLPEFVLRAGHYRALTLALTASARPGTFNGTDLDIYRHAWSQPGALTSMLNWYRALAMSPRAELKRIRTPVGVLWGDRDTALERGLAEEGLDWCDNGEALHLPNATHWLHHEEPERVNAWLVDFLTRARGAASGASGPPPAASASSPLP